MWTMQKKDWIYQTNIYEVNLRQYTSEGTIKAFSEHLPRLKAMGVHTLWFMPITPISKKEMKGNLGSYYACSDYTSINPEFGTMDDFKSLVDKAHELGFKVIIDWVANHTGWDHKWTREHPEWYEKDSNGNFKRAYEMDDIIELDFQNSEMRSAMIQAMQFWIDTCDIDGFRCDLAFWVELDFWLEAIPRLNQIKPLFWLAEMDPLEYPEYMQVFDAAYAWTWMHKTEEWYKKGLSVDALVNVLSRYLNSTGMEAWFTSNHDENSWNGTEYEKYGDAALPLCVHSCTWPGIPLIYSGQELPNTKRLKFFDKDVIDWNDKPALDHFYKELLHLKLIHPALNSLSPVFRLHSSSDANIFSYLRKNNDHEVLVILNLSSHQVRFDLKADWLKGEFREIFTGLVNNFSSCRSFEMKAWEYRVFTK